MLALEEAGSIDLTNYPLTQKWYRLASSYSQEDKMR